MWLGLTDTEKDDCMDRTLIIIVKKAASWYKRVTLTSPAPDVVKDIVASTRIFLGLGVHVKASPLRFPTN